MTAPYQNTVLSSRDTSTLSVAEGGDTSVEAKPVDKNLLDILGLDGLEVPVKSTFGDDDDALALADLAVLLENIAHGGFPVLVDWRVLRDEDKVCPSGHAGHQCEPAAVAAHDLDDEGTGVR